MSNISLERDLVSHLMFSPVALKMVRDICPPEYIRDNALRIAYNAACKASDAGMAYDIATIANDVGMGFLELSTACSGNPITDMLAIEDAKRIRDTVRLGKLLIDLEASMKEAKSGKMRFNELRDSLVSIIDRHKPITLTRDDTPINELLSGVSNQLEGKRQSLPAPGPLMASMISFRRGEVCVVAGSPGRGKSLLTTLWLYQLHKAGIHAELLPLESTREFHNRRMLGILSNNWNATSFDQRDAVVVTELMQKHFSEMKVLSDRILENPGLTKKVDGGIIVGKSVTPAMVLGWIRDAASRGVQVLIFDPWTQVSFSGSNKWTAEEDFVRTMLNEAASLNVSIIIVAHTTKGGGKNHEPQVQGSASLTRLPHVVMLLEGHDDGYSSTIRHHDGTEERLCHRHTIKMEKTRSGRGTGCRLAYTWEMGPLMKEVGLIVGK